MKRHKKSAFKFGRLKPVEPNMIDRASVKMSIKKASYQIKLFTPFLINPDMPTLIDVKIRQTSKLLTVGKLIKHISKHVGAFI